MRFQPGDVSTCSSCKTEIVFVDSVHMYIHSDPESLYLGKFAFLGPHWTHKNLITNPHLAQPIDPDHPEIVKGMKLVDGRWIKTERISEWEPFHYPFDPEKAGFNRRAGTPIWEHTSYGFEKIETTIHQARSSYGHVWLCSIMNGLTEYTVRIPLDFSHNVVLALIKANGWVQE